MRLCFQYDVWCMYSVPAPEEASIHVPATVTGMLNVLQTIQLGNHAQVNATLGTDMEYIFSHSTLAGSAGYYEDPWAANQVKRSGLAQLLHTVEQQAKWVIGSCVGTECCTGIFLLLCCFQDNARVSNNSNFA